MIDRFKERAPVRDSLIFLEPKSFGKQYNAVRSRSRRSVLINAIMIGCVHHSDDDDDDDEVVVVEFSITSKSRADAD